MTLIQAFLMIGLEGGKNDKKKSHEWFSYFYFTIKKPKSLGYFIF